MGGGGATFQTSSNMSREEAEAMFSSFFGGDFSGFSTSSFTEPSGRSSFSSFSSSTSGMPGWHGSSFSQSFSQGDAFPMFNVRDPGRPSNATSGLDPGTKVTLSGLSSRHMNGLRGVVKCCAADENTAQHFTSSCRVVVSVAGRDDVSVKVKNCQQHPVVTIDGLANNPELNGSRGTLSAYVPRNKRFLVEMANGSLKSLKPTSLRIPNGTVVSIAECKEKKVNGQLGRIISKEGGRYTVRLHSGQSFKLKPENVRC